MDCGKLEFEVKELKDGKSRKTVELVIQNILLMIDYQIQIVNNLSSFS